MAEKPEITIEKQIGSGGFGKVYKGVWNKHDVAIKILNSVDDSDKEDLENSVKEEIKIHKTLSHENIIIFYDSTQLNDSTAIITEYAENGNLASMLKNKSVDLNWDTRGRFAEEIALGI